MLWSRDGQFVEWPFEKEAGLEAVCPAEPSRRLWTLAEVVPALAAVSTTGFPSARVPDAEVQVLFLEQQMCPFVVRAPRSCRRGGREPTRAGGHRLCKPAGL